MLRGVQRIAREEQIFWWVSLEVGIIVRLVIDVEPRGEDDLYVVKECIAMALEPFGKVRVVSVIRDGKEQK